MADREDFWRLEHLSDRQLLERLQGVLRTQRCSLAEVIAHLGEVEDRRLHLVAAHDSMFSYCVQHLGMSEDEACRRIALARLARRFPRLFGELASGRISLSVALLLKPVLTPDNHAELIAAARGASLRTARELLARRFPSADVPSRIRKLPVRLVANTIPAPALTNVANAIPVAGADVVPAHVTTPRGTTEGKTAPGRNSAPQVPGSPELDPGSLTTVHAQSSLQDPPTPAEPSHAPAQTSVPRYSDPRQRIDPLSAERYRIQFTADVSLKQKIELARDLMRHSNPSGDLGPIVSQALDLLLQELLQRRFGARRKDAPRRSASLAAPSAHEGGAEAPLEATQPSVPTVALPAPARAHPSVAAPPAAGPTSYIPRAARRAVLERDGLGCCWVDASGKRCGSRAWLELDHHHPSGKGGSSEPENVRLLCRAHNRFAAERAYGRDHVARAIQARKRRAAHCGQGEQPSSPVPA